MKKFAVSCYSSPIHSWWFSSHPPPAPTARTEAPRFTIPAMKRERQEKRPFVYLARLLNSMTGEEWENYGLDPKVTAIKIQNIQLAKIGVSEPLDPLEDVQDGGVTQGQVGVTAAVHGQKDVQGGCVTQDQDDVVYSMRGQDVLLLLNVMWDTIHMVEVLSPAPLVDLRVAPVLHLLLKTIVYPPPIP